MKKKILLMLILIPFSNVLLIYISNRYVMTNSLYFESLKMRIEVERIQDFLIQKDRFATISYVFVIILQFIHFFTVSVCIQIGTFIQDVKINFTKTLYIVLLADIVFLFSIIIKIIWFLYFVGGYTLEDVQYFMPLSALSAFNTTTISKIWIYPLQTFNLFEILYWVLLALGIRKNSNVSFNKGLNIVFCGYIPMLLLWILGITFLIVTLSP